MKKFIYIKKKLNEVADPTIGVSGMVQGNGYGYVYRILPFNKSLEQKPNDVDNESIMHVGSPVCGYIIGVEKNDENLIEGKIIQLIRSIKGTGEIVAVKVQPTVGGNWVYLDPDDIRPLSYDNPTDTTRQAVKMFEPSHNMRL